MTDVHNAEQRSRNMAAIKSANTKPEMRVRKLFHSLGYRFRLHRKDLPGKPDIVLPKFRTVVFVHGCFWHSHNCRWGAVLPVTRADFWVNKREGTKKRDLRNQRQLKALGWTCIVIWECQTRDLNTLMIRIKSLISPALG